MEPDDASPRPSGFFVMRTPLLPFDALRTWGEALETGADDGQPGSGEAFARRRVELRARLARWLEDDVVREALVLASPDLHASLDVWRARPESERGQRLERALVRYFLRLCGRATPFGLFAGCSLGRFEEGGSRLRVGARDAWRRCSRLDLGYLDALGAALESDREARAELSYRPNSSLYRAGGRWRYVEVAREAETRGHRLVALDGDDALHAALELAADGRTPAELSAALAARLDVDAAEARAYVETLIDAQVLVGPLSPPLTGEDPAAAFVARVRATKALADAARGLEAAQAELAALDARGPGAPAAAYESVAAGLRALPAEVHPSRLVQVDLFKPAEARLGARLRGEIERAVALLARLDLVPRRDPLAAFRERFEARWQERAVPLAEALDDEHGVGFAEQGASEPSALLEGLEFKAAPRAATCAPGHELLLRLLAEALTAGRHEIELGARDLERLSSPTPRALPAAFALALTLGARSCADLDAGRFVLVAAGLSGPSGARLLGRFCHTDDGLRACVASHLRAEEAHRPQAVFAELVHLPEGRSGNVLARPVLRDYEIAYLGVSGAEPERRLSVDDLMVSVAGGRVRLTSRRLQREVVPRLTTAHNYLVHGVPLYRFLALLQDQDSAASPGWSWGALSSAPFLPRVRVGRLVLARASWRLTVDDLAALSAGNVAARFRSLQELRARLRLPRFVELCEGDQALALDLDNAFAVETLIEAWAASPDARLTEMLPTPDELPVEGQGGRFVAELIVPFEAGAPTALAQGSSRATPVAHDRAPTVTRVFPPGAEWLEWRLFCGPATADRLIADELAPLARRHVELGTLRRWFFARLADEGWHVRVRFHGAPDALHGGLRPEVDALAQRLLDEGRVQRSTFDTYTREVERYGGPQGVLLAEDVFHADSDAVADLLSATREEPAASLRPMWLLRGLDALLDDFGLELTARRDVARAAARGWRAELSAERLQLNVDRLFRRRRAEAERLLGPAELLPADAAPARDAFALRSRRLSRAAGEMQRLARAGHLATGLQRVLLSLGHMHANRLLRGAAREQEWVAWDFLERLYDSALARSRGRVATRVGP